MYPLPAADLPDKFVRSVRFQTGLLFRWIFLRDCVLQVLVGCLDRRFWRKLCCTLHWNLFLQTRNIIPAHGLQPVRSRCRVDPEAAPGRTGSGRVLPGNFLLDSDFHISNGGTSFNGATVSEFKRFANLRRVQHLREGKNARVRFLPTIGPGSADQQRFGRLSDRMGRSGQADRSSLRSKTENRLRREEYLAARVSNARGKGFSLPGETDVQSGIPESTVFRGSARIWIWETVQ